MATVGNIAKIYQCPYVRGRTIASVASHSYTDSANGFVKAGFADADSITVSGFTTGGNNGIKTINATPIAGAIQIAETIGNESAGDDIIIVKNVPGNVIAGCSGWSTEETCEVADVTTFTDTIKESYTSNTIAFVDGGGSNDTITDSANQFVIEGFVDGDEIWISGSTSNNYVCKVIDVAAGVLTVPSGTVTAEIAGDTVTIRSLSRWKKKTPTAKNWTATINKVWLTAQQELFGVPRRYEFFIKYYSTPSGLNIAYYKEGIGIARQIDMPMSVLEVVKSTITIDGVGALTNKTKTSAW